MLSHLCEDQLLFHFIAFVVLSYRNTEESVELVAEMEEQQLCSEHLLNDRVPPLISEAEHRRPIQEADFFCRSHCCAHRPQLVVMAEGRGVD